MVSSDTQYRGGRGFESHCQPRPFGGLYALQGATVTLLMGKFTAREAKDCLVDGDTLIGN